MFVKKENFFRFKRFIRTPRRWKPAILSRFSRLTNSPIKQKIKLRTGSEMLIVLPDTLSIEVSFNGDYEPKVTDFIEKHIEPGQIFFDIGAHFGLRSLQAVDLTQGKITVFAFEPGETQLRILKENIKNFKQIKIVNKAVSSQSNQRLKMQIFNYRFIGSSTLEQPRLPNKLLKKAVSNSKICNVRTISIDEFCKHNNIVPDFIKIDVENHELKVLHGGLKVLNKYKPKLVVETDTVKARKLLVGLGYKVVQLDENNIGAF